jgi:hypothetical protein
MLYSEDAGLRVSGRAVSMKYMQGLRQDESKSKLVKRVKEISWDDNWQKH